MQLKVFFVVMLCSVVVGYQRFGVQSSETLVSYRNTVWHHNPENIDLNQYM